MGAARSARWCQGRTASSIPWSSTGSLNTPRYNHTATLLSSGKVLVAGGQNESGPLSSVELYDPAAGTWSSATSMASARYAHTALAAGRYHTLALRSDDSVWAWGWNYYGQFGDGTSNDQLSPVQSLLP